MEEYEDVENDASGATATARCAASGPANCTPVRIRVGKEPVGKSWGPQGNQRKRNKTVEDEARDACGHPGDQNRGSRHEADSDPGAPG